MYQAWADKYREYYGYDPASTADLQEFIDWWLGQGLFAPEPDDTSTAGGPSSIYTAWLDKFYDYYGRYPYTDEELEEFIRWWQGTGIYTEPVGDGLWPLLLLALLNIILRYRKLKNKENTINI